MKVKHTLILLFVITLTSAYFGMQVIPACDENTAHTCFDLHREIMSHTALAPYQYRILSPVLIQLMGAENDSQFLGSFFIFQVVQFALFFTLVYRWLRYSLSEHGALLGVALIALTFPLMFKWYYYAPYSSFEVTLIAGGLCLLSHMKKVHANEAPLGLS